MRQPLNLPSFFLPHLLSYSSFDVEKEYLYSIPILFVIFTIRKMTSATNRKVITETRKSSIPKICFLTVAARVERFPIPGRARPIIGIMTSFTSDCTTIPRYYPGLVQILRMIELSINYMRRCLWKTLRFQLWIYRLHRFADITAAIQRAKTVWLPEIFLKTLVAECCDTSPTLTSPHY